MSGAVETLPVTASRRLFPGLGGDPLLAAVIALILSAALVIVLLQPAPYLVNMVGQLAAFAILAVSLDLVWGYLGILSLGHGLFFAIGGYVCAMHLLSHAYAVTGMAPDLMQFMGWKTLPLYWSGLASAPYALVVALVLSAAIAFLFGYASFRSRVNGVYFSIISQALVYVAMLLMFRNDTGLGGNNGMTGFPLLFGHPIGAPGMVTGLAVATLLALALILVGTRALVVGRIGRRMLACRDDEARLRTLGYSTTRLKLGIWCLSATIAALAGILYVPQVGIINPRVLSPDLSIEIAVWVAIGGMGRLGGAVIGAVAVNALKFWLSAAMPEAWPFILSGLVLVVVLGLPNGLLDLATLRPKPTWLRRGGGLG
ncbi:urea ABC transporter permease subunit UrtC [Methylobacterium sp. Leaf106]|uniref:urea ABC transporter permease subunit UrtC n=1 Tax=Methylobacterium sp. Leaf106 TaxID=1736255 RepID=UPI0006FCD683|nr:urea ABC transporter permease subunit UrtC [Methylobacterium sp. Leaf106]KQP38745.1 urea ABC transporter permease subunit UrtC [Methylobacterium sp. Leaf106]